MSFFVVMLSTCHSMICPDRWAASWFLQSYPRAGSPARVELRPINRKERGSRKLGCRFVDRWKLCLKDHCRVMRVHRLSSCVQKDLSDVHSSPKHPINEVFKKPVWVPEDDAD